MDFFRRRVLTALLVSVILGTILGAVGRFLHKEWEPWHIALFALPGEIFILLLHSLALPLICTSLIIGISSLNIAKSQRISIYCFASFLLTTFAAILVGFLVVIAINPGQDIQGTGDVAGCSYAQRGIQDTFAYLFSTLPSNPEQPMSQDGEKDRTIWRDPDARRANGMNIFGLVVVSILMGISIATLGRKVTIFRALVEDINLITLQIATWIVLWSPIGIFFLIFAKFLAIKFTFLVKQMGLFIATIFLGMLIHVGFVLPSVAFLVTERNPLRFMGNLGEAVAVAFATASSTTALPITMKCCEEKCGIHRKIVRFVIPIGSTLNMNGTALYEVIAVVFVSQTLGRSLFVYDYIVIGLVATVASIGTAGIPQSGFMTLLVVLNALGLSCSNFALLFAMDWLLDRFRTVVNLLGDAFVAQTVGHLSRKIMENQDQEDTESNTFEEESSSYRE